MEKLKPCPFCGGEAFITPIITNYYEPRFTVFCKECNAKSKYCKDEESAIAAWNRRADDVR